MPLKNETTKDQLNKKKFAIESDEVITIGGMRGTGKTTLARFIASQFKNLFVWDPLGQYPEFDRYVPQTNSLEEFDRVARAIWERGNIIFMVEECENVLGERMSLTPYAFKIILQGRNKGIGLIAVTRRIANLSKTVFSLSNHVFLFRFFSPNDIKYCQEFIGKHWAEHLRTITRYNFLYYSSEGEIIECPKLQI